MDKTIRTSDVSLALGVGALHMVSVQMVLLIDQILLQKGVLTIMKCHHSFWHVVWN